MLYEWRKKVVRGGPPVLAPTRPEGAQFRSVYAFPTDTVQIIQRQQSMKNLNGKMVASDTLLIDVDDAQNVDTCRDILIRLGIKFQEFTTGNRGRHWHIPIDRMIGVNVIYSQTQWLKSVGLWDMIDTSIYRPAGQFRCIGAKHRKTGELKRLVKEYDGKLLHITTLTPPPVVVKHDWICEEGTPEAEFDFFMNVLAERGEGRRHMHMYITFQSGKQAGLERAEIEDCIRWWNRRMTYTPHSDQMIDKKLRGFK